MPAAKTAQTHRQEASASSAVFSFVQNTQLQAQLALYRGFIHEVNNTLAGVGTLAEALKGSHDSMSISTNLDLIAHTTQKVACLQQRMRAMYPSAHNLRGATNLSELIDKNSDLLELMISRSYRVEFVLPDDSIMVRVSPESVWSILAMMMQYVATTRPAKSRLLLNPAGCLTLELLSEAQQAPDDIWGAAFELVAEPLSAQVRYAPGRIDVQFAQ